tara:strand:- start:370 stop:753 length:384 start_codon:yes stop_codon:yes gene_type:complete
MKKLNNISKISFHLVNLTFILLYLYPGSIFGYIVYSDFSIHPQITRDFLISSNHFYVFIFLSTLGIIAYQNSYRIGILIKYLFLISIILELTHIVIPQRGFELKDLLGNISGVILVIIFYKLKKKYA